MIWQTYDTDEISGMVPHPEGDWVRRTESDTALAAAHEQIEALKAERERREYAIVVQGLDIAGKDEEIRRLTKLCQEYEQDEQDEQWGDL